MTDPEATSKPLIRALRQHDESRELEVEWKDPFSLSIDTWDFADGTLRHFPNMDFIVHDITELSPGVMFEIGCSERSGRNRCLSGTNAEKNSICTWSRPY
jgi:hypothetical protein